MPLLVNPFAAFRRLREWATAESYFYAKLLTSSAVGVTAILLLGAAYLFVTIRDHQVDTLRTRTLDVLRVAHKIENELTILETTHRGFLLTADERYLKGFEAAKHQLTAQLNELSAFVADRGNQSSHVDKVRSVVAQWATTAAIPDIEARKKSAPGAAPERSAEIDASTLGKSFIDEARRALTELKDEEELSLNAKTKDQNLANVPYQTLVFTPKLRSVVSEMKKAQWGYLLTGSPRTLDNYKRAINDFYAYQGHLSVLLADDPDELLTLTKIKEGVERWQREAAVPEITAKSSGRDVTSMVGTGRGDQILEDVYAAFDSFEQAEDARYDKSAFQVRLKRFGQAALLGGLCVLTICVLIGSSWYSFAAYRRHLRKIESAEAQTRSIIETTLDGVVTIDDQGLVQSMNPAAENMFGHRSMDVIGHNVSMVIPQRLFLHDMNNVGRGTLMAVGQRQNYYPFPIEISLNEMKVGSKRHFVALIRDVTERKRSEETLRNIGLGVTAATGEEFLRSLIKQLSKALQTDFAFIVQLTRKGAQLSASLTLAEQGHIRSRHDYPLINTACEDVLKRGYRAFQKDVRLAFPDDRILDELNAQSFLAMPLTDHQGNVVGIMGVIDRKPTTDLMIAESTLRIFAARAGAEVERKRFEDELATEKERLAVTLRSIGDGCITIDVEGRIVLINKVAEKLTGWSQAQAQGQLLTDVFHVINDRTRQPLTTPLTRLIETGSAVGLDSHALIVAVDGNERLIESSAALIRDRNNRRIGVVLVFRDVTEKHRIEEERRKAEKLESLGVAAGGIAHDFNNLLTSIIGNVSLALLTLRPEESITERLISAKKASLRAQELAQQLLTFAKGGAPIKKTASIAQLIHDTVSFSLRGTNVRSEFELDENLWPAEIDPGQISQVIGNLTVNAEQAMPAGGMLALKCHNSEIGGEEAAVLGLKPGRYVAISLQDQGIGIPEQNLKKIFDPYFSTKPKGSGLGLATAYSIVKHHDGHMTVDSRPGEGSNFTVYLPASAKPILSEKPQASREGTNMTGRIMILDDEEDIRALVAHALTPFGYEVAEAADPTAAIELYEDSLRTGRKFAAVISDLTIPGTIGGQAAVKRLLEIDPKVRAIVSSGYAMDPVMSNYREYGFCACLAKPCEITALCAVVNRVVAGEDDVVVAHEFAEST